MGQSSYIWSGIFVCILLATVPLCFWFGFKRVKPQEKMTRKKIPQSIFHLCNGYVWLLSFVIFFYKRRVFTAYFERNSLFYTSDDKFWAMAIYQLQIRSFFKNAFE